MVFVIVIVVLDNRLLYFFFCVLCVCVILLKFYIRLVRLRVVIMSLRNDLSVIDLVLKVFIIVVLESIVRNEVIFCRCLNNL